MNKIYGFEGEVNSKFNETMVKLFAEIFCYLPLASVLNKKVFVVHGGLFSSDSVKLADIAAIDRFREPPDEGTWMSEVNVVASYPEFLFGYRFLSRPCLGPSQSSTLPSHHLVPRPIILGNLIGGVEDCTCCVTM